MLSGRKKSWIVGGTGADLLALLLTALEAFYAMLRCPLLKAMSAFALAESAALSDVHCWNKAQAACTCTVTVLCILWCAFIYTSQKLC